MSLTAHQDSAYQAPDLSETAFTYASAPVEHHGPFGFVWPGRRSVQVPGRTWPAARPEECTDTSGRGEWITPEILVCPGCGLDST